MDQCDVLWKEKTRPLGLYYEIRMEDKNKLEYTSLSWPVYEDVLKLVWVLIVYDFKCILQRPGLCFRAKPTLTWSRIQGKVGKLQALLWPNRSPNRITFEAQPIQKHTENGIQPKFTHYKPTTAYNHIFWVYAPFPHELEKKRIHGTKQSHSF